MSTGILTACPDCAAGEHHPTHEVSTLDLTTGQPITCPCPCAEGMYGPQPLTIGERGTITHGRWVGRTLTIDAIQGSVFVGTIIDHLGQPRVVHIFTNWVERTNA